MDTKQKEAESPQHPGSYKIPWPSGAGLEVKPEDDFLDYTFSILYNYVTLTGEYVLTDVLKVLYSQKYMKSLEGSMTIYDFCKVNMHWTDNRIHDKFGKSEFLTVNVQNLSKMDVDSAYRIIVELCGNAYDWLSSDCRAKIRLVKNYKYKICRKYGLSDDDLEAEVDAYLKLVESIYSQVGLEFHKDFTESLTIVKGTTEHMIEKRLPFDAVTLTYDKDYKNYRADMDVHRLIHVQRELEHRYSKLAVSNPFVWMDDKWYESYKAGEVQSMSVENIYTPLKRTETGTKINVSELLSGTKKMAEEEVIVPGLILSGIPGSGKTSLCYHLAHDWYKGINAITKLGHFDLVLLFEHCKFQDMLLKKIIKTHMLKESLREVNYKSYLKGLDVLFILDGFDEGFVKELPIVDEILEHFSNKRIIITTGPSSLPNMIAFMHKHHMNYHIVEVCELDEQAQVHLAKAVFMQVIKDPLQANCALSKFISTHHQGTGRAIVDHLRLPITAALYMAQWKPNDSHDVGSATELHQSLFTCHSKLAVRMGWTSQEFLDEMNAQFPNVIGKLAWEMLKQRQRTIVGNMDNELRSWLQHREVDPSALLLAFLTCCFDLGTSPPGMHFSFVSRQQQAYFAAKYLSHMIQIKKMNVQELLVQNICWKYYPLVLLFLIGNMVLQHMDNQTVQKVIGIINETDFSADNFKYWWNLYVESQGHSDVRNFLAHSKLPKFHWVLNELTVVPALRLLADTPVKLKSIKIDIPSSTDPFEIPEFLSIAESLPVRLSNRYTVKNRMEVEMHFWKHDESGGSEPSDRFLCTLHPWGTLVNFTGELGEQGWRVINGPCSIRTIRARLKTPEAVQSLAKMAKQLPTICRRVRITVDLPEDCNLENIPSLCCAYLEISFLDINEDNQHRVTDIIRRMADSRQGIFRVSFNSCSLNFNSLKNLMKNLSGLVTNKVSVTPNDDIDEKQQHELQKNAVGFTVSFF